MLCRVVRRHAHARFWRSLSQVFGVEYLVFRPCVFGVWCSQYLGYGPSRSLMGKQRGALITFERPLIWSQAPLFQLRQVPVVRPKVAHPHLRQLLAENQVLKTHRFSPKSANIDAPKKLDTF